MSTPTDTGFPCPAVAFAVLAGMSAPLLLGGCAAEAPAAVPFPVRLLIFVIVTAVVAALVFGAWMVLRSTPVPVPSGKDSAHE